VVFGQGTMPVIEENTGFIYCVEVNLDDVVVIRLVGLHHRVRDRGQCEDERV